MELLSNDKKTFFINAAAILLVVAIAAWFFYMANYHISNFLYESGDTAVAEQALWNTIHGDWFYQSFLGTPTNFREHLNFIQFLYLPFYALVTNLLTLYFVINLVYGVAAVTLFFYAKEKLGSFAGFVMILFFLLHPITVWQNAGDMHVVALGAPFLLLTLIFYEKKKYHVWLPLMLIVAFTSEFVAPTVFMLGVLALLDKRPLKWIVPPIIAGMLMFLASTFYIITGFGNTNYVLNSFRPSQLVKNNFYRRLGLIEEFFRPALYLVPFFSKFILLIVPTFLLAMVVVDKNRLSSGSHLFSFTPAILVIAIIDIMSRFRQYKNIILILITMGLCLSLPICYSAVALKTNANPKDLSEAVRLVADGGSVTATRPMSYHLNHRHDFYLVDNKKCTDYVILKSNYWDSNGNYWDSRDKEVSSYLNALTKDKNYVKVMDEEHIVVYVKKSKVIELVGLEIANLTPEEIKKSLLLLRK